MRKILIVDHESTVANFIATTLQSELGCQTTVAYNEPHAMALLHSRKFDLVISDAFSVEPFRPAVGGGDRWRWLITIRNLAPETPLIATSAYTRFYQADYHEHGLLALLSKPFKADELVEAVLRALANGSNVPIARIYDTNYTIRFGYQAGQLY